MNYEEQSYDQKYKTSNFFGDRRWLYLPFVREVVRKAELQPGASLLDAGCGQGFFTCLFAEQGINALGVDVSAIGVEAAKSSCDRLPAAFQVGDVLDMPFDERFDCVFIRSCSLYNNRDFPKNTTVTDRLLQYVKPGGIFVFDYYTRLRKRAYSENWVYHKEAQVRQHFAKYGNAQIYFTLRVDARFLRSVTFTDRASVLAGVLSRTTGIGGELVVFLRCDRKGE